MKRYLNRMTTMKRQRFGQLVMGIACGAFLAGCAAGGDNPGLEYAPNMYHSVAYEPYKQVTDTTAGRWLTSIDYPDGHAEFYNSNSNNPFHMNMRMPPDHVVARNKYGWLPYRIPKDSLTEADALKNPFEETPELLKQGKALYEIYCDHCHGGNGDGDGPVSEKYAGVANFHGAAYTGMTQGHIFHVIAMGKGLMMPHGSQVNPDERWKIAMYVKQLQSK